MIKQLKIGTRDSKLALIQTQWVANRLQEFAPDLEIQIIEIKTQGDQILDTALSKIGDKGLFTKELEIELLAGRIDLAVHSMKDLPTQIPDGLQIIATTEREDIRDVICFAPHISSMDQVQTLATSSLRRIAQIKKNYPVINCVDMRGNLQTRFRKLDDPTNKIDAMVLAAAGIKRLGLDSRINVYCEPEEFLPAVGQGALGIEIAISKDLESQNFLRSALNHQESEIQVLAERAFLRELQGGCQVPIGAYSILDAKGQITLHGLVISLDGQEFIRETLSGLEPEVLGIELAQLCLKKGARKILDNIWTNCKKK